MRCSWIGVVLLIAMSTGLIAQEQLFLDSIHKIEQHTYVYKKDKKVLETYKETVFDTNQIMIDQHRYHYLMADTGLAPVTHYQYHYNPEDRTGEYFTEQLPHPKRPNRGYSKRKTMFKSIDHKLKRRWVKQYDKEGNLSKQTINKYDENGQRIYSKVVDKKLSMTHIDDVKRNEAGNMTIWESFDDDGTGLKKVRDYKWTYQDDTLLLESEGYIFNTWNKQKNKYKKGKLFKSFTFAGNRQHNGKVSITHKTKEWYDKQERLSKKLIFNLKKKAATMTYSYADGLTTETVVNDGGTTTNTTKEIYEEGCLLEQSVLKNGKLERKERITYNQSTKKRLKDVIIEYRSNDDEWKTVVDYDILGNPTSKKFYINDQLQREDVYTYQYMAE